MERVEYANLQSFPSVGESDKIYVALNTHDLYLWSASEQRYTSIYVNLFDGTDYSYKGGFIDTKVVPNNDVSQSGARDLYLICSRGNPVYYWDGISGSKCKKLEGLFQPELWQKNHSYSAGQIVRPPTDNGYVYVCVIGGTSGNSDNVPWEENLSQSFSEGTVTWKGVGSYLVEGSSASNVEARFVEYYKGFVFLANLKEGGTVYNSRLRWSQLQNPRLWHNNEDDSGMAGFVDVDDVDGEIVAIKKLNDILVVYKEKGIVAITFTGGDTVFSKELITTKTGLVSSDSIVELPHSHIFVGDDNIYEFDGSSIQPIGDSIKDYFFNTLNPSNKDKIIGYYDDSNDEVLFAYDDSVKIIESGLSQEELNNMSMKENRRMAITFNTLNKTWSKREMYITAIGKFCQNEDLIIDKVNTLIKDTNRPIDSNYNLKDKIITIRGDEEGNIYKLFGQEDSRYEYYGYVTSKTHHMEDPSHIKRLLRIQFHIETTSSDCPLVVEVGTSWNSETQMHKWETHNINLSRQDGDCPKPPFVDVDLSARYFR